MKENEMYTTVIVVESAHEPTHAELRKVLYEVLDEGKEQGFEPIRAKGVVDYDTIVEVVDKPTYDKWIQI